MNAEIIEFPLHCKVCKRKVDKQTGYWDLLEAEGAIFCLDCCDYKHPFDGGDGDLLSDNLQTGSTNHPVSVPDRPSRSRALPNIFSVVSEVDGLRLPEKEP